MYAAERPATAVVVFDVDDTLYLERDYVRSGFRAVAPMVQARWDVTGFAAVAWQLFLHGRRHDIFDCALSALGVTASKTDVDELVIAYRRHAPQISMRPDAADALRRLQAAGVAIAVITDGPAESQHAKVAALDLRAFCTTVILTDEWGPDFAKPHDRAFRSIMALYPGGRWCYVGDNPAKDFSAPHALGWTTVRVRRLGGLHVNVSSGAAVDIEVRDLRTLPGVVGISEASGKDHQRVRA